MSHAELHKDLSIRQIPKPTLMQVVIHPMFATLTAKWKDPALSPFSVNICSVEKAGNLHHQI